MDINRRIGIKIKEARTTVHLTQQQLGKLLGKSGAAIAYLEQGKRRVNPQTLSKIAKVTQHSIAYFYEEQSKTENLITETLNLLSKQLGSIRKQVEEMEKERRKAKQELQAVMEITNDVIVSFTPKGNIRSITKGMENVQGLGYSPEELIGKHFSSLITKSDTLKILRLIALAWLKPGRYDNQPFAGGIKGKNGTLIPTEGKIVTHMENGKVTGVTALLRDIRKRPITADQLPGDDFTPPEDTPPNY